MGEEIMPGTVSTVAVATMAVVNSLGINTHIDFNRYGYENFAVTAASINYLGLKNLRDCPGNDNDVGANGSWQQIASATGAKFDAYMTEGSPASDTANLARVSRLAAQGILNFVEGGNENDDAFALSQGNSIAWTASFQRQVFATGHALGLPVINMSFGSGWTAKNNWRGNYDKVGDLSAFADYANAHTYPMTNQMPEPTIRRLNGNALLAAAARPVITTEIGWNNAQFPPADAARHALYAVFDGMKHGNPKTYFYALFDDRSGKFGFMNQDGSAKPSGTALHNLTTILADSAVPRRESLAFGLSGTTPNDNSLLMGKSNSAFQLALWNEVDAAHGVTLTLDAVAQTIKVYDPLAGISTIQTASNTRSIAVNVPNYPIIVEIAAHGSHGSN
jgi:hypothetical protein